MSYRFQKRPGYSLHEQHRWADFFELVTVVNIDGELDLATMKDRLDLKERDGVDTDLEDSGETEDSKIMPIAPSITDSEKEDLRFLDYFRHFKYRSAKFGEFYPFQVANEKISLKDGFEDSLKAKLYIYLLCCSALSYFQDLQLDLTSEFEELSYTALKKMFPQNTSHLLGKTTSGAERAYQGNVYNKLKQLGDDLSAGLRITEDDFASTSSGDGGLDLISWYGFKDSQNSIPTYSGQCKCSPKWVDTRDPATLMEGYFDLDHPPVNLFFIPYTYRKSNGNWYQPQNVKRKVVIESITSLRTFGK